MKQKQSVIVWPTLTGFFLMTGMTWYFYDRKVEAGEIIGDWDSFLFLYMHMLFLFFLVLFPLLALALVFKEISGRKNKP